MRNGINRNILECKDASFESFRTRNFVLIETYWNVKSNAYEMP